MPKSKRTAEGEGIAGIVCRAVLPVMDVAKVPQTVFATRTEFGLENTVAVELSPPIAEGSREIIDMTISNPTRCGFQSLHEGLLRPLSQPGSLLYSADPMGSRLARVSVADDYYAPRNIAVNSDDILLTSSTSEAYGYLFKLLCDAGDQVLVPSPSYPLFDLLARLHDVELVPYRLHLEDDWRVHAHDLESSITSRTRALIVVHPNNPTGHFTAPDERELLQEVAARHGLALIVDEVFLDYPVEMRESPESFLFGDHPVLTFVLSGLSKVCAMPQMKLGWTVICGPDAITREARARMEIIADSFLSVNTPACVALPFWLRGAESVQREIRSRIIENLAACDQIRGELSTVSRLPVRGGWSVLLRVPSMERDEELVLRLLRTAGVQVHPGSLFGFSESGWAVASLIVEPGNFLEGLKRSMAVIDAEANRNNGS